MKVSILGASGKVGLELVRLLATQTSFVETSDIVLYSKNNISKILGNLQDMEESSLMLGRPFSNNVKFLPSDEISDIQNSNLIIVCAGLFATKEEKEKYYQFDASGRNIQSFKNYALIKHLALDIKEHSLCSDVIVVTNQSDMMSQQVRQILPAQNVFGLGCYLDSLRFKKYFLN